MSCIPSISPCHGSSGGTVISMIKCRFCLSVHCLPGFLSLPLSWSPDMESNRCVQWPSEACLASILQCLTAKSAHFKHLPPLSPLCHFQLYLSTLPFGQFSNLAMVGMTLARQASRVTDEGMGTRNAGEVENMNRRVTDAQFSLPCLLNTQNGHLWIKSSLSPC